MGETTKINWSDSTCNFWSGCTKVSAGCQFCYAEALSNRGLTDSNGKLTIGKWGKGAPRQLHESAFKLAHRLNKKAQICDNCGRESIHDKQGKRTTGMCVCQGTTTFHRRRIFSLSLGDWLDPEVPVEWLARMLDTVRQCQDVDWLLCTKRPELWSRRLREVLDLGWKKNTVHSAFHIWVSDWQARLNPRLNIIILTSVENQEQADKRIPELLRIPAWRRGLSCEPLLGPVDLKDLGAGCSVADPFEPGINWVIVGGESGNKARACNVEWVRSLRDQCKAASVPCFVKQLGSNATPQASDPITMWNLKDKKGGDWNEWPDDLRIREFYQ